MLRELLAFEIGQYPRFIDSVKHPVAHEDTTGQTWLHQSKRKLLIAEFVDAQSRAIFVHGNIIENHFAGLN